MWKRQRLDRGGVMGERAQRNLRAGWRQHVDLRQRSWIVLKLRLNFEDDLVLAGRGIDGRDLPLTERVVKRLVDQRGRKSEPRSGVAINLDRDMRRGDLLVRRDVLQFRKFFHRIFDDRRPMIELIAIGIRQRVLVLSTTQPTAEA